MPLTRYQIRSEYSLADQELYREADKDDPEALLEGVAMAGLVGVLRQLGDLAEFAAEIFHDLHEEVMATAARGHGLVVRVQQLEAEFSSIEKAFLSQTSHSLIFYNTGVIWHPNLRMDQNLIMHGDLPRFVMDSYEECRGPPRLFLLDKFDVAGAGSCLKRYTDPSFFKVDSSSFAMMNTEVQREKKNRKAKKKGSRRRNGETPEVVPTSHAKLQQLFLDESVENYINDPARRVKLKRRLNGFPFDSKTGKSYMEKFLKTPTDHSTVRETSGNSSPLKLPSNITGESRIEILEIGTVTPVKESLQSKRSPCSSPRVEDTRRNPCMDELREEVNYGISELTKPNPNSEADIALSLHEEVDGKKMMVDGERKIEGNGNGYQFDDIASEVENYVDALTTMDSEMETDTECRAKNNMGFLNIENQVMDSDANEEEQDHQAHFSDDQSMGTSTATDDGNSSFRKRTSSFSYSDSPSNLAENTPSDGDLSAKVFLSTEINEAEIVNMSSDWCSVNGESLLIQPLDHKVSEGACIEEAKIPSYRTESREPSSSSRLTDSATTLSPVDAEKSLMVDAPPGSEFGEISSNHNELNTEHIYWEENRTSRDDNLPCTSNLSDVPSLTRDDVLPELSAEDSPVDELDDEDPHVLSHSSLHLSNILELAPATKSSENLLGDMLRAECTEEECTRFLVDSQIDSPKSVASHREEHPLDSTLPELETCVPDVKPDGKVSEVDDAPQLSGETASSSTPVVGNPQASNFRKQHFLEITENVFPLEPDSDVGFSYSSEGDLYGALNAADGEDLSGFSFDMGMVGKNAANIKFPSDFQISTDLPEVHLDLDDATETIHSEAMIVANAVADTHSDDNRDNGRSLTTSPTMLQEESISILQDLHQSGLAIYEACSPENHQESGTEKVDQQAVASSDLDYVMPNTVSYDDSKSELLNNVTASSMAALSRNSLHVVEATSDPLSSDQNGQDSKSKSPWQINVIENIEDAAPSPSHHIAEIRTPLEQKDELQADQFSVESWHACKESSEPLSKVEWIQSPNHLDQEGNADASFEFCAAHLPRQPSQTEFLPQLEVSEQAIDPSNSTFPSFGLLSEVAQINLDEMPPLPPLPPVQWRMGKVQHYSLAPERDLVGHNLYPFPQILPFTADEKARLGHLALEGDITQPLNPLLPLSAAKVENSEQGYENLAGYKVHSTQLLLQVPTMANCGNNEDDFPTSGGTQSTNPLLPLSAAKVENSEQGYENVAGYKVHSTQLSLQVPTMVNCGNNEDDFLTSGGTQSTNPLLPLSAAKVENSEKGYENLAGYKVHSTQLSLQVPTMVNCGNNEDDFPTSGGTQSMNPFLALPTIFNGRSQNGFLASEGGTATLNPFSPVMNVEDTISIYPPRSLQEKLTQPQHQLPPQMSSEDKKLQGAFVVSEGEALNPPETSFPRPDMQDDQPQHGFYNSEGDTICLSSTSVALAPSEDGKPNGNRKMKLPRPRNPLIDAVVAHDKSKLKKVTERVRPKIGQELDERNSLLEQIRTKSFNLKPAVKTRPSIKGPKTNLKVAAILEKANAIRQALAGSDEDDDVDGWSDS